MIGLQRLLIFDLDGALVDSMEHYTLLFLPSAARASRHRRVVQPPRLRIHGRSATGTPVRRHAGAKDVPDVSGLTAEFWSVAENHAPPPFPEVLRVLRWLRLAGHTLVISSGGRPQAAAFRARHAGLDELFALILGTDEGIAGVAKGPGHFAIVRDALGLSIAEFLTRAVFVGDGVYDMQVAGDAGIPAIGRVTGGNGETVRLAGAQSLIDDLSGVAGALAQIEPRPGLPAVSRPGP